MSRKIIPVAHPQLTSLDLEAFVSQAKALNQRNQERFTTPFPKHDSRWISHYQCQPRPITFTDKGAVEGGLSWLVGATLDFSFARDLCAGAYGARGGHCYDPASLVFLEQKLRGGPYPLQGGRCELSALEDEAPLELPPRASLIKPFTFHNQIRDET